MPTLLSALCSEPYHKITIAINITIRDVSLSELLHPYMYTLKCLYNNRIIFAEFFCSHFSHCSFSVKSHLYLAHFYFQKYYNLRFKVNEGFRLGFLSISD